MAKNMIFLQGKAQEGVEEKLGAKLSSLMKRTGTHSHPPTCLSCLSFSLSRALFITFYYYFIGTFVGAQKFNSKELHSLPPHLLRERERERCSQRENIVWKGPISFC